MSKSYRRGGDDRFESRRRRNEKRSVKRDWVDRDDHRAFEPESNPTQAYATHQYQQPR
jgi:hypothetical protein